MAINYDNEYPKLQREIERLRAALAKSCEEGRELEAENEKLKECIAEWQKDSALNGRW